MQVKCFFIDASLNFIGPAYISYIGETIKYRWTGK